MTSNTTMVVGIIIMAFGIILTFVGFAIGAGDLKISFLP